MRGRLPIPEPQRDVFRRLAVHARRVADTFLDELAEEILDRLKRTTPAYFEKIVVELLVNMGYGGTRSDAGKAIGRSGDGGIDGIIKEDKLGLDVVYIQAKRWVTNPVGRPDVMQFAGALQLQHASKGIFNLLLLPSSLMMRAPMLRRLGAKKF